MIAAATCDRPHPCQISVNAKRPSFEIARGSYSHGFLAWSRALFASQAHLWSQDSYSGIERCRGLPLCPMDPLLGFAGSSHLPHPPPWSGPDSCWQEVAKASENRSRRHRAWTSPVSSLLILKEHYEHLSLERRARTGQHLGAAWLSKSWQTLNRVSALPDELNFLWGFYLFGPLNRVDSLSLLQVWWDVDVDP